MLVSRLSVEDKKSIVSLYKSGDVTQSDLAKKYDVSQSLIGRITRAAGISKRKVNEVTRIYTCYICKERKPITHFYTGNVRQRACKECDKERSRNNGYFRNIQRQYGIDKDQLQLMKEDQNYSCYVCGIHEKDLTKRLCIDHNHDNGKVRALLCDRCNNVLGKVNEDLEILESLKNYLIKFR